MNIDPNTALLAAGAAALFVGGGVVLGSAFGRDPKPDRPRLPSDPELFTPGSPDASQHAGPAPNGASAVAEAEPGPRAGDARRALEAERALLEDRLEQSEVELKGAREGVQRALSDLDSKQSIIQQMGAWLDEARQKVRSAEEELLALREAKQKLRDAEVELEALRQARQANEAADKPAPGGLSRVPRPESLRAPDPAAFATLRAEITDLRKKVDVATGAREAAEAKAKALETLIEAARARSRELARELEQLKSGKSG
jgi:hypothetical protein